MVYNLIIYLYLLGVAVYSRFNEKVRKNYEGADIITYLPLDTITNARRFLRTVRPVMAFFIKYEFWYNYLHILKHRHIPVYSVSSIFRPDQVFFKWYGRQYGRVLNCFTHFFVQNTISKELLAKIGITNVTIVGDTRFDRVLQIKEAARQLPVVEAFKQDYKVFVAGSSWPPDEEIFIRYFNEHKDWKLIIAPHVIGEDHLEQIEKLLAGRKIVRYKDAKEDDVKAADVLIINCYGLLSSIYHYGDVAYVGGGFGVGIHNLLEAAVWDVPVFFGPNNQKFQEAQGLKKNGGFEIHDYEEFERQMSRLASDAQYLKEQGQLAGQFVKGQAGATAKVLGSVTLP